MYKPLLTPKRIKIAFVIAVFADALEFPIAWLESFDSDFLILSGKFMGVLLDCVVMAVMTWLLGFQWVFFPSFCIEAVPKVDMFPTWVAAVAYVVWQQKQAQQTPPNALQLRPLIDVEQIKSVGVSLAARLIAPPPPPPVIEISGPPPPPVQVVLEQRLKRLNDLRDKNLISQSEYDAKREQILAEI